MGYALAGFDVIGVDIKIQPRYPFEFHQENAFDYLLKHGHEFDAIHASPPCQHYSIATHNHNKHKHPDLIPETRFKLEHTGKPYIIENVPGASNSMVNPIMLCGTQFGLKTYRHRLFESNILLLGMHHIPHRDNVPKVGKGISDKGFISIAGHWSGKKTPKDYGQRAMGIDWMTVSEMSQAIPPAYTRYLGKQLIRHIQYMVTV